MERAKAEFGLFDPVASSDWESYNEERTAAEEIMEDLGDDEEESELFVDAVKDMVRSALGSDRIGDEDCEKIVNAISLTGCDICWDMDDVSGSFSLSDLTMPLYRFGTLMLSPEFIQSHRPNQSTFTSLFIIGSDGRQSNGCTL